jgi:p-cumate 2,3-dioxygenase ferredoxin subunit
MARVLVGRAADIPLNTVQQMTFAAHPPIALYHLADGFYATDDLCSHGEASLAEGEIEDGEIVCPFHLGRFEIRSGAPCAAPCAVAIKTYSVIQDPDGNLYLDLP